MIYNSYEIFNSYFSWKWWRRKIFNDSTLCDGNFYTGLQENDRRRFSRKGRDEFRSGLSGMNLKTPYLTPLRKNGKLGNSQISLQPKISNPHSSGKEIS